MSAPGELIADRYRLVRLVGSGGMGAVWEARDERLARPVALKQLHAQTGVPAAEVGLAEQRAMREARITARLHHPHAVGVFDVVEHDGRPCLVMQYLPSTPLSELLRRDGALDPSRVAVIGAQTSAALAAAHAVGIVHRDVKPGNILITEDGSAVLSDFGISHALGDATLTSTGLVHGTPAFLAPEVARGAESGFASDVYSLGATLYTAVEGAPPFGTDPNAMALLHRIASEEPRPAERAGALAPLIEAMLTALPENRPAMTEVARRLRRLADPGSAVTTSTATMPLSPVDAPTRQVGDEQAGGDDPTAPRGTAPVPVPAPLPEPTPATAALPVSGTGPEPAASGTVGSRRSVVESVAPPASTKRERPGWLIPAVALAAVVVLLIGVGWLLTRNSGGPTAGGTTAGRTTAGRTTAGRTTAGRTTAGGTTSSSSKTSASTRSAGSASPTGKASNSTGAPSTSVASDSRLAAAITDYYALLPDGTDAGWDRLTTRYQQGTADGRSGYDRFWAQVRSVAVQDANGDAPDTATARIVYTYRDGRVVTDHTRFGLVLDAGTLKIDSSRVLSSNTPTADDSGGDDSGTSGSGRSNGKKGPGGGPGASAPAKTPPGQTPPGQSPPGKGKG